MDEKEKGIGGKALALLGQGPFRRYIIGSLISDSGTWMQMMAQSWVLSGLTNKAILLGLVNFAAGLPALALAPIAGSLADRWDKRKILIATQIVQSIVALISLPKRPIGTPEEEEQRRSGIREGFRYVCSNRLILSLIAMIALNTIFVFPAISVMLPLYVRNILHLGAESMGGLMAVSGSGAFLGSIGLFSVARENRLKFMGGNVAAIALGVFLMSWSQS